MYIAPIVVKLSCNIIILKRLEWSNNIKMCKLVQNSV